MPAHPAQNAAVRQRGQRLSGDSKSAAVAAERVVAEPGAQVVRNYSFARDVLRSSSARQAGAGAELVDTGNPDHAPVFYLDGEAHQRKRGAIARFFTAKAVTTRHRLVMERATDALLSELQAAGRARLDELSMRLAVAVAGEIVGLTNSNQVAMASRISATLSGAFPRGGNWPSRLWHQIAKSYRGLSFFVFDVKPAIAARRKARSDDIISHLLDEGYSDKAILIECMTYAAAGMVTTREFIVMCAWHLLEREELRARFLAGSEAEQFAILEEILRLEPVAAMVYRRTGEQMTDSASCPVPAGTLLGIDLRAVNTDESMVGACPHMLDPDRAQRIKATGGYLSFGYGAHRCPGWQVAMHETRLFVDRLLRMPGIRLEREPTIGWCEKLMSYELRNAVVVLQPAG
jgi:cytochrome P450